MTTPIAEKLLSPTANVDYYLLHHQNDADMPAALNAATLSLIKNKADAYVICADACYLSDSEMEQWNICFRKLPRDWHLLPAAVHEQIRDIKPEYEIQWQELYREHMTGNEFYDYIQENFDLGSTASRLIRNILDYVEAQEFSDTKLAQHHLHALLDGAFGLTQEEILQFGAGLEPETVGGYRIIDRVFVEDLVFKLGYNPNAIEPYSTWRCDNRDNAHNYWGHYWPDKTTAQTDLLMRSDAARTDTPYDHTLLLEPRTSLKSTLKANAERSKAEFSGTTLPTPPGDAR